jgi:hypothetical protein
VGQKYNFSFSDSLIAEVGGITLNDLHFNPQAIIKACEAMKVLARQLKVKSPVPHLAGFCYPHIASLGVNIEFPENSEPKPDLLLSSVDEIDRLKEPEDYLAVPLIRKKLSALALLRKLYPEAPLSIGHLFEGPVTTAVLILGKDFLTLPYDSPQKAHKLLEFSTTSALNYAKCITDYLGISLRRDGIPDDFAGMFPPAVFKEFVVPYWEKMYTGIYAEKRFLHSELLRVEHLFFLKELNIKTFDPSADQYVTPELLSKHCPCDFQHRIKSWEIKNLSSDRLEELYVRLTEYKPCVISFSMDNLETKPKIKTLLNVARKLSGE